MRRVAEVSNYDKHRVSNIEKYCNTFCQEFRTMTYLRNVTACFHDAR